ncbi:hypothetical protein PGT21_036140 [Puccinia graminis f. sp. tritici]|uniref:J domain-containing protein n=2 Tax=Puccinia graminis f. sp. tritici TaxID=56615 RepID=A0A5B0R7C5_PUCGR|nr:hypothetical protein PGT21_036140 [Puccinia graminis f. sp. tritici]KAA1121427.1 hypothetical protein PGTUg99_023892 [Puccinia graminis f. sp. tritici]
MAKKKSASNQNTAGPKASTSKAKKQDPIPKTEKPAVAPTLEDITIPSPTTFNTPSQRRKSSIPESSQARSTPKRRTSSKTETPVEPTNNENELPEPLQSELQKQAEAKKEEGNVQFKSGKFNEAIASYSEAIRINSDNPAYLANRAAALMSIRNYQSALADMQLVNSPKFISLGIQPTTKNILRLIRCYLPLGHLYQARQSLKSLLESSPDCLEAKKEDVRLKKLDDIIASLQRDRTRQDWSMMLIGLDRLQKELDCGSLKAKEWLIWKVEALCGQKKWEDAKCICNELVRSYSSDPEVLYYRAKVMYSQGNLAATVSHCQEAIRCDPGFSSAGTLLRQARKIESLKEAGNTSFKASDYKTAIEKYLEASSIDPTNESILLTLDSNRAQALLKSEQYAEGIEVCNKILKIDKQHFKALRTRARAKKADSELDAALADFEAAAKIAPTPKDKTEISNDIKTTKILIARSKYVDHYKVLGVSRNASDDEIKKAFRKQSLIHHPDKGGNEEKFKEVNESYTVLQDPQSRRKFDMIDPDNPQGGSSFYDGFDDDDESDQMPFGWEGLFGSGAGSRASYSSSSHYRSHAHAHTHAHSFGGGNPNPFFTHTRGF